MNVEKNKLYFLKTSRENIFITSIVDYEGSKEICVYYNVGYGASEKSVKKIFTYDEYEEFCKNLETKQKIKTMSEPIEKTNNFKELRCILFETIRGVKDGSIDVKKAKSISEISQVLINTAKVEIEYIKSTGNKVNSKMIE